jgi:hypothetical protein
MCAYFITVHQPELIAIILLNLGQYQRLNRKFIGLFNLFTDEQSAYMKPVAYTIIPAQTFGIIDAKSGLLTPLIIYIRMLTYIKIALSRSRNLSQNNSQHIDIQIAVILEKKRQ